MTATTTRRPFRRSSEREVVDPHEAIAIEEDRRRDRELQAYEEVGFSAAAASVLVRRPTLEEICTDDKLHDDTGMVRP